MTDMPTNYFDMITNFEYGIGNITTLSNIGSGDAEAPFEASIEAL
jgi:hypothetical protein